MNRRLRAAAPAALVAVVCGVATVAFALRGEPTAPVAAAPSPARDTTVLGDLRPGMRITGWNVVAITDTPDGGLDVTLERDGVRFVYTVIELGRRAQNPPFASARHALYYGHARPPGTEIPAGALRATSAELLRRIQRAEQPAP